MKKKLIVVGIILLALCCCACFIIFLILSEPYKLNSTLGNTWISENQYVEIKLECSGVRSITFNGEEFDYFKKSSLCGEGYSVKLENGNNIYTIQGKGSNGKSELVLTINFDLEAYTQRQKELAEERSKYAPKGQYYINYSIGQVISGISMLEIQDKYTQQQSESEAKGIQYLLSLKDSEIHWVGTVLEVKEYLGKTGYYIELGLNEPKLFDATIKAIIDIPVNNISKYKKNQLVKVKGVIDRVDDDGLFFGGLTPYIKNTTVEIIK